MELSPELRELLRSVEFAPLREALAQENILTVESFRSVRLWVFLNQHDLYSLAGRQAICARVRELLANYPASRPAPPPVSIDNIVPDDEQEDKTKIPYSQRFSRDPLLYQDYPTLDCGFSVRVIGRLQKQDILNVGQLLEKTDEQLLAISGFGANSINEIHKFLARLEERSRESMPISSGSSMTQELLPYKEEIWAGNFAFAHEKQFSMNSHRAIWGFQEAHRVVDPELIRQIRDNPEKVTEICDMLQRFIIETERIAACEVLLKDIPEQRTRLDAKTLIKAYSDNKETITELLGKYQDGQTLTRYVFSNAEAVANKDQRITKFIKWCSFDVIPEIEAQLQLTVKTGQANTVLEGRVNGDTLAGLGEKLNVTRERIRQVEAKIFRLNQEWFRRHRIINKISVDLGAEEVLPSQAIADYLGDCGPKVVYLLKEFSGKDYRYDQDFDLFLLQKPEKLAEVRKYLDALPEIVAADKMKQLITEAITETHYPEQIVRLMVQKTYQRTGDTFHRSRLSLATVYEEILRKYYPNGIHIDEEEIRCFRELVQKEYSIDLSDRSFHAISSIIGRVGVLCGRGRYKSKRDIATLTPELTEKIRAYVETRTLPITLFTSIYAEFETELVTAGINDRYSLQGVLRELFDGKWYFRKDYVSTDAEVTSFYETLGSYIAKATSPVSKDELKRQFPGITDIVINMSLDNPEILNLFGSYIHVSRLTLTDEDIQYFHDKVEEALATDELCYVRDLYTLLSMERPGLLSRNYVTSGFCLYSLLEYLFGDEYNFSRPFIAREGAEIKSIQSVLKEMVQDSETIALSEVLAFASEHHYSIAGILDFADLCNDTHLLINDDELASIDYIGATEETAKTIEKLILAEINEATPIAHLECISQFPKLNVEWNAWLIYSILHKWSQALDVGPSKYPYRISYPVVAPAGMPLTVEYDERISHSGELVMPDNLDNIEELIADYLLENLGGTDEV